MGFYFIKLQNSNSMMKWCHYISLLIETINDKIAKNDGSIMYIKKF